MTQRLPFFMRDELATLDPEEQDGGVPAAYVDVLSPESAGLEWFNQFNPQPVGDLTSPMPGPAAASGASQGSALPSADAAVSTAPISLSKPYPEAGRGEACQLPSRGTLPNFETYQAWLDATAEFLFCRSTIEFRPVEYPPLEKFLAKLKIKLTPLGVLILPAHYGATGAALALMRLSLNTFSPNPSFGTVFHRLAFGAVAGVVLVWFVTPESPFQAQMTAFGLSLFGLAFLVGFSLEYFFAVFDRLLALVTASTRQYGAEASR